MSVPSDTYGFVTFVTDSAWRGRGGEQAFRLDHILGWRPYGLNYVHKVTELKVLEGDEVVWYGAVGTPEEIEAAILDAHKRWSR